MDYISVSEYAELRGCTVQYVRKLIKEGKIRAEEQFGSGGRNGMSYKILLADCEPKLIKKYNRIHGINLEKEESKGPQIIPKSLEQLSAEEREEVAFWKRILEEWQEYRNSGGKKSELDEKYVRYLQTTYPDQKFSVRMLYRKQKTLKEIGESALADGRGKHDNHKKSIPDTVWGIFCDFYLDESRKTVRECMRLTAQELENSGRENLLPLASESSFGRAIQSCIEVQFIQFFRFGQKAYRDQCEPIIKRSYEDIQSNDIWVCDNHTFDIFLNDGKHKKPVRVYLTAFMDVRSRKMVGWYVTDTPCSDATLQALRRGIEKYGIPKKILSDNGREFLTLDIGGRGFRKGGQKEDEHYIPTILDQLQIDFRTALPKRARSKTIERAFREIKEQFSKLFEGYTGGNIAERPERLKTIAKKAENFTPFEEFIRYVDTYIEGCYNYQTSEGVGMRGKTRNQVYAENLYELRTATSEELNLMLMRNSRMVTFQQSGLTLRLYGTEITYWSEELWKSHLKEKVYYRYNPDDLREIRVYDEQDRFIGTAQQRPALGYYDYESKGDVAERMSEQRKLEKYVASYKKKRELEIEDALTLKLAAAERNQKIPEMLDPKIITPIRKIDETEHDRELAMAAGMEPLDWTDAIERLRKEKED